jgi:hypothetical protein
MAATQAGMYRIDRADVRSLDQCALGCFQSGLSDPDVLEAFKDLSAHREFRDWWLQACNPDIPSRRFVLHFASGRRDIHWELLLDETRDVGPEAILWIGPPSVSKAHSENVSEFPRMATVATSECVGVCREWTSRQHWLPSIDG